MIDALRRFAPAFLEQCSSTSIRWTLGKLLACRTPALGGHLYECDDCGGYSVVLYNSCGSRYCSQCQGKKRLRWAQTQQELLLPIPHFQVVFTLPAELRPLARAFPREIYDLLFHAANETLQKLAVRHWDATPAILAVLHTWARDLSLHPHVHCVVSSGGLDDDGGWVASDRGFLFPHRAMQRLFRGLFLKGLSALADRLDREQRRRVRRARRRSSSKNWVVFIEVPDERKPQHLVNYLARYVYQNAISDHRIVRLTDGQVTIATRGSRTVTLAGTEFVRRLTQHFLPKGFRRIRHFGLLAPGARNRLALARDIVEHIAPVPLPERVARELDDDPRPVRCPHCQSPLRITRIPPVSSSLPCARAPP